MSSSRPVYWTAWAFCKSVRSACACSLRNTVIRSGCKKYDHSQRMQRVRCSACTRYREGFRFETFAAYMTYRVHLPSSGYRTKYHGSISGKYREFLRWRVRSSLGGKGIRSHFVQLCSHCLESDQVQFNGRQFLFAFGDVCSNEGVDVSSKGCHKVWG